MNCSSSLKYKFHLQDIALAINNSSKVLDTMAEAFTEMGQQFKRMNDIAERYLLEKKK